MIVTEVFSQPPRSTFLALIRTVPLLHSRLWVILLPRICSLYITLTTHVTVMPQRPGGDVR